MDDFKILSELEFWNTSAGLRETSSCPPAGDTHARMVRISQDERTIAVSGYRCVRVLDRESLRLHRQTVFEGEITDLAFAANGRWLILAESGRLHLVSVLPQAGRADVVLEDGTVRSIAVARENGRIATTGSELAVWNSITTDERQRRLLRDLRDKQERNGAKFDPPPYWSDTVVISDGGQIVAGTTLKGLALWRAETDQVPRLISGRDFNVGSISLSRDGRFLAYVAWLHPDHLLNPKDEEKRPLSTLSIDPARLDRTYGDTAEVRVWDVEKRDTRFVKTGVPRDCVVALSDDGTRLAYSKNDGSIGFQPIDLDE